MHSDVAVMSTPSIWREALHIANEEGFMAFWKGILVTIIHRLPYTSVNFYAFERYKTVGTKVLVNYTFTWLKCGNISSFQLSSHHLSFSTVVKINSRPGGS